MACDGPTKSTKITIHQKLSSIQYSSSLETIKELAMYICMYVRIYMCAHTYTYMYVCVCLCSYVCMYVLCMYVLYVCMRVMCVCMYAQIITQNL